MSDNSAEQSASRVETDVHAPHRGFLQQPLVQNVLPFATSIFIHLGILLLGYATFKAAGTITSVIKEQIIIPDAELVEGTEVGRLPNPGLGTDPNIISDVKVDVQEQQKMAGRSSISVGQIGGDTPEGVIGIGSGTAAFRAGGIGADGEGNRSPFGVPGGSGGMGPRSPFMGVSGNAYRIVYMCDASGSMLTRTRYVIAALKESIDKLKPVQFFNVFFYHPGGVYEVFSEGQLVPATPENKRKAYEWVEGYTTKSNGKPENLIPVVRAAMPMKPQLLYLLTDGFGQGNDLFAGALRAEFNQLNKAKEVHVNIVYLPGKKENKVIDQDIERQLQDTLVELKGIADDNGGRFRIMGSD